MTRATSITWRWLTTAATIAAAAIALMATSAAPALAFAAPAPASTCTFASQAPNYVGWVTLAYRGCPNGFAQTADCKALTAYRWTGRSWQYFGLNECGGPRQVYVYPYAAGWSWVWSQQTGWLAVQSSSVLIRQGQGIDCIDCAHAM
jgi:hypothetical protein